MKALCIGAASLFFERRIGMKRTTMLAAGFCFVLSIIGAGGGVLAADTYPVKPITFIIPLEAGADGDILARPLCQKVSQMLGQPLMIVNKPGAGSSIGYRDIYAARPDGYTIGWGSASLISNKMQGIMNIDHEAFTLIGTYATYIPIIVASMKTQRPFKMVNEMLSFGKARPGEISIATSGVGQTWWTATMALQAGTGIQFNIIPQPGAAGFAIAQVLGGHTDLGVTAMGSAKTHIDAGTLSFLAVFGSKRAPGYEKVPTLKDVGYDINFESTQILIAPPKMPKEILDKLSKAFLTAANEPDYQKLVIERNAVPIVLPPDKAKEFFNEQRKVVRSIMEKAGILKEN